MPDGNLLGARSDEMEGVAAGVQIRTPDYADFSAIKHVVLPTIVECEGRILISPSRHKLASHTIILGFALDRDWRQSDSWFCSELVAAALEKARYFSFCLAAPANKITPADLLLAVSATAAVDHENYHNRIASDRALAPASILISLGIYFKKSFENITPIQTRRGAKPVGGFVRYVSVALILIILLSCHRRVGVVDPPQCLGICLFDGSVPVEQIVPDDEGGS